MTVRNNSDNRYIRKIFNHIKSGTQDFHVTAKFIYNCPLNSRLFLIIKQHNSSIKLCKNTAPVNVTDKQNRCVSHFRHAHIDNVVLFQIYFRRTSRTLNNDYIVHFRQFVIRFHNIGYKFLLIFKVVHRIHIALNFTVYNNL